MTEPAAEDVERVARKELHDLRSAKIALPVEQRRHAEARRRVHELKREVASAYQRGRREGREEAAKLMETFPERILHMWERPGGPPGNGYAATTNRDRAQAILAIGNSLPLHPAPGGKTSRLSRD